MLRVDYTKELGFAYLLANDHKTYLKVAIHSANCLCAFIYHYKKKNAETGKKEGYSQLVLFFNDLESAKLCLGLKASKWDKDKKKECIYTHKDIKKIRFNVYYKDMAKLGELWAKAGFKVELYYKEPKTKKRGSK